MRVFMLLAAALVVFVSAGSAQERTAPPGEPLHLWLASASQDDGKVVIQIASPAEQGGPGGWELRPGVGTLPATTVMYWLNWQKVILGKTVYAYRVARDIAGLPGYLLVQPDAVLKALAKPTGVAVYVRTKDSDPARPDDFYLALLREGTMVLVVHDLLPPEP